MDNFAGHKISYEPTNIQIEYFEPNLTSFVQPLDAGIIRNLKAIYRRMFCERALDLDDADEPDVFKINLLEAMLQTKEAWASVKAESIANCWRHTGTQRDPLVLKLPKKQPAVKDSLKLEEKSRALLKVFITSDMTLPQAEDSLSKLIGPDYVPEVWQPVFDAILEAENDVDTALDNLALFERLPISASSDFDLPSQFAESRESENLESVLMGMLKELKSRNRVHGKLLTFDELVSPLEEVVAVTDPDAPDFAVDEDALIKHIQYEKAVQEGRIIEIESDDEEDVDEPIMKNEEILRACAALEASVLHTDAPSGYHLIGALRKFRAELNRTNQAAKKQTTLDGIWMSKKN